MSTITRFWNQPCKPYRNFQVVFTLLTLNFVFPAIGYSFDPATSLASFSQVNNLMGGGAYPFNESDSHLWRHLAAANVMTLGLMCGLLQVNVFRFWPVLLPLTCLKMYAALSFGIDYFFNPGVPLFLGGFLLDGLSSLAFVFFASRARRAGQTYPESELVPQPREVNWL